VQAVEWNSQTLASLAMIWCHFCFKLPLPPAAAGAQSSTAASLDVLLLLLLLLLCSARHELRSCFQCATGR
jgi:hypothetical protein